MQWCGCTSGGARRKSVVVESRKCRLIHQQGQAATSHVLATRAADCRRYGGAMKLDDLVELRKATRANVAERCTEC